VIKGDKGEDIAPDKDSEDGTEVNPYYETITFEPVGDVTNAKEQTLSVVRYHQVVSRKSNDEVFHDQIGYWIYDPKTESVIETVTIPRAVTLIAGGSATITGDSVKIDVVSEEGSKFGIAQSPFMSEKAKTTKFTHTLTIDGDSMEYREVTFVDIYGRKSFEHSDENILKRQ